MLHSKYRSARAFLFFRLWPLRAQRLFRHFAGIRPLNLGWWIDLFLLFLDFIGLFDLYEFFSNLFALKTRGLTPAEVQMLQEIYGDSLPYSLIKIDERAHLGPRQSNFCYVSFHTINSWGPMQEALLIHEAMHIWQYIHFGGAYIGLALRAQHTEMGYNYGGGPRLRAGRQLSDFNFEQQGDIMADAYRVRQGRLSRWSPGKSSWEDYWPYVREVQQQALPAAYR